MLTLLRLGAPMGVQMIMVSLAEIAVITFVNHFGSDATAAYAAVNQIGSYVQFPALSIGIAASISARNQSAQDERSCSGPSSAPASRSTT